jgi:hypothetical protein
VCVFNVCGALEFHREVCVDGVVVRFSQKPLTPPIRFEFEIQNFTTCAKKCAKSEFCFRFSKFGHLFSDFENQKNRKLLFDPDHFL